MDGRALSTARRALGNVRAVETTEPRDTAGGRLIEGAAEGLPSRETRLLQQGERLAHHVIERFFRQRANEFRLASVPVETLDLIAKHHATHG